MRKEVTKYGCHLSRGFTLSPKSCSAPNCQGKMGQQLIRVLWDVEVSEQWGGPAQLIFGPWINIHKQSPSSQSQAGRPVKTTFFQLVFNLQSVPSSFPSINHSTNQIRAPPRNLLLFEPINYKSPYKIQLTQQTNHLSPSIRCRRLHCRACQIISITDHLWVIIQTFRFSSFLIIIMKIILSQSR